MAQKTKYTNKDLLAPVDDFQPDSPSGQTVSGQSMSGQMEDDFQPDDFAPDEPEDPEVAKQQRLGAAPEIVSRARGTIPESTDKWGAVFRSLYGGEALDKSMETAGHILKKSTVDLPNDFIQGILGIPGLVSQIYNDPIGTAKAIPGGIKSGLEYALDTMMHSGGDKTEEWGNLVGQIAGQPLVTGGLVKGAPPAIRAGGYPVGAVGTAMKKYQPISTIVGYKTTGFPLRMPILKGIERQAGRGIEAVGERMKNFQRGANAPVPSPTGPTIPGGRPSPPPNVTPPSNVPPVAPTNVPITPPNVPNAPSGPLIPVAPGETSFIDDILGTPTPESPIQTPATPKRRLKLDSKRGSYIDLDTGEEIPINIDKTKPINPDAPTQTQAPPTQPQPRTAWPEGTKLQRLNELRDKSVKGTLTGDELAEARILDKELRNADLYPTDPNLPPRPTQSQQAQPPRTIQNAPPNQRAKIMRGAHDPVDVFFENAADREIFGAGQRLGRNITSSSSASTALVQRYADAAKRVAEQYKLTPEKARRAVSGYNEEIRNMSKQQPPHSPVVGDLNFKAPTFQEYLYKLFPEIEPFNPNP